MNRFDTLPVVVPLLFILLCNFPVLVSAAEFNLPDRQWALLAIPANAEEQTIESLFADDLPIESLGTEWIIYRFDKDSQSYVAPTESDSLLQSDGFWIIQLTGSDVTIDIPESLPSGHAPAPPNCASTNGCFITSLPVSDSTASWAIVGAPFRQAINVSDIRVQSNQQSCAGGCSLNKASTEGLVHENQWAYDTSSSTYKSLVQLGALQPWQAFWLSTQTTPAST